VTAENIRSNYFGKLQERFNTNDYPYPNSREVYSTIISDLDTHYSPEVVSMIHGDFWFSNILLDYTEQYRFIDMKGQVDSVLTLNGDKYYDYGKLFQSILGYDMIINNDPIDGEYIHKMREYFLDKCDSRGLNIDYLKCVTKSLVFGTFPFMSHLESKIKDKVWEFLSRIDK
jgi:hypothetical protein